jgi:uncharacterized membrane protein YfhO
MSDNPYAPPKAEVEVAERHEAAAERPRQIVWVVQLAAFNYALGLVSIAIAWEYFSRLQSMTPTIISQSFTLVILFWLYYKIYQGRNWARIVWLVLSLLGLAVMPFTYKLLDAAPGVIKVQMFIGFGVTLAIIWLLFFSPGKYWFRRAR